MNKVEYFTSMDIKYYNHCGKAMLESFVSAYDKKRINLYNEGNFNPNIERVSLMGWNLGSEYHKFAQRWNHNRKIVTFAKKGFSIIHAMNNIECDRLIWLDADSIITNPLHWQLIDFISPDDCLSTHFKVKHVVENKVYESCETGFFILNKKHPKFNQFKKTYTRIYMNDITENLRRFYDGEVYGETVRILEQEGAKMIDLNPGPHKTPISRSLISTYFQHFKAGIKDNLNNDIIEERFLKDNENL